MRWLEVEEVYEAAMRILVKEGKEAKEGQEVKGV
jgi:hypothetical protein